MHKKHLLTTALLTTGAALPAVSMAELTANAGWVSDYIFRGIFQEDSSPYGGIDWASDSGFYAGVWGADVEIGLETDIYFGYSGEFGDGFGFTGAMEKIGVAYRAVGYAAGPDGKAGTGDDLKLGYIPAKWAIAPADHTAEEELDHKFAGSIDDSGVFTPGDAGPNPQRKMSANNVGRLSVVATVEEGARPVRGQGRLLVSVPDFVHEVLD